MGENSMTRQPLVTRYVILKPKLEREIAQLESECREYPRGSDMYKCCKANISLHNESLELLKDTFNGEGIDIT